MADGAEHMFNRICATIQAKDYSKALKMLSEYEARFPEAGSKAALLRAKIASDLGDFDGSVCILSEALDKWPDALALRYTLSCHLTDAQQWQLAKEQCDTLIADSLRLKEAYFLMDARVRSAWCSVKLGLVDDARQELAGLSSTDSMLTDDGLLTVGEILSGISEK